MQILRNIKHASPPLSTMRVLIATILVLAIPLLVYYLIYVRKQTEYFSERGLRSLTLIGDQVALKVESAGSILKYASEKFINPNTPKDKSPKFEPTKKDSENLRALASSLGNSRDDSPQIIPISIHREPLKEQPLGSTTISGVSADEGTLWLYLTYQTQTINGVTATRSVSDNRVIVIHAKTNFTKLLRALLSRRENIGDASGAEFQDLLIAEASSGRVFFQMDPTEVSLASVDKLPADNEQKSFEIKELDQSSKITDIRLAGSIVKLFSEPLEISLRPTGTTDGRNTQWIIAGFIASETFRAEAWSVSYTLLIVCAFITSLLILNWPFIKLVLIGPKDRLRTADIYFLTFSTVVVLGLVTSFGLYAYSYKVISDQLDAQLIGLSTEIQKHFAAELKDALSQLTELGRNQSLLRELDKHPPEHSNVNKSTDFYRSPKLDRNNILPALLETDHSAYPYFDNVAWIDQTGQQRAKWTIRAATTHYINVETRAYFRNLRLGNFQELEIESTKHQFVLEPIVSRTTGRNEVEISKFTDDPNWITALETRLISLMQPVLPTGFGYLIIDKNGKVLFHSDEAHHLGENIFKECDDDPKLRSAVVSKNAPDFSAKYLGQDYSLLVRTVEGFPDWSLVVFRNKQTLRSAFLELLSSQSLLFFIYSIFLMAGFTGFYLINRNNGRRSWIWPSPKKARVYQQSLSLMFVLSVFSLLLVWLAHGQSVVILTTLISFIAIFVFFMHLWASLHKWFLAAILRLKKLSGWSHGLSYLSRRSFKRAYVLNLGMLLVVVAILPSAAYFKFAFYSEMELFVKHGQFTIASGLAERNRRIRSQYAEIEGASNSDASIGCLVASRLENNWDIYDQFFFETKQGVAVPPNTICLSSPSADNLLLMTSYLPLSNRTSIERRALLQNPSSKADCLWRSSQPSGDIILELDKSYNQDISPVYLSTSVPQLGVPGPVWWLLLLLTFVSFFSWVNFMVKKVFLLDVQRPARFALNDILERRFDRNRFFVLEPPHTELLNINKDRVHLIDVRQHAGSFGWVKQIDYKRLETYESIVVSHFDYQLEIPSINQQKLYLLERLLKLNKPITVFSEVEPSLYQFSNGVSDEHGKNHDDQDRWAGMVSEFCTEYVEECGQRGFVETIGEVLGKKVCSENQKKKLINFFKDECSGKQPLERIGIQIICDSRFKTFTHEDLLRLILNQSTTYYSSIWRRCSPGEQLTLWHLAQDRLLSHRDPDIEPLMRRGLIVRKKDVHVMNESFRQFVLSANQAAVVSKIEETAKRDSAWNTLKAPLMIVLIAITIFLFATQRDLYTSALAGLTALTTMIPALFKVLSLFQKEQARPTVQT